MSRSVFLVGFMAAGKTTVGKLVAERLELPFADLDEIVEQRAGTTVAGLFDSRGEGEFRRLESAALRDVIAGPAAVVATGGGAPCDPDNLNRMRQAGLVVALSANIDELVGRVSDPSTRPLLSRSREQRVELFESRQSAYRRAHAVVRTEGVSVEAVADSIVELVDRSSVVDDADLPRATVVALASGRSYPVVVAAGARGRLAELLGGLLPDSSKTAALVSDDHVSLLYGESVKTALEAGGYRVSSHVVPAGETSKSVDTVAALADAMVAAGLDRRSVVVALGGGVVGDLAGFVASVLFRGISVVQLPTTVVAMTDSAIGGKTGVNLPAGKNLVGAFWQPSLVLADTETLATLPERERRAGFGELIKYGLLDSEELLDEIDALAGEVPGPDVIARCAAIKSWIVALDEREQTGERALLNLGHTLGHAIEASAGYGVIHHGEAVALGLIAACRVSARMGLCDPGLEQRVAQSVRAAGLDTDLDRWLTDDVIARIGVDKKRTRSFIRFVALEAVGRPRQKDVALADLERILRA